MAFGFSMLNGADEVRCQISAAAIDELGGRGGSRADRDIQLSQLHEPLRGLRLASSTPALSIEAALSVFLRGYSRRENFGLTGQVTGALARHSSNDAISCVRADDFLAKSDPTADIPPASAFQFNG
jgi:hypothetical protein